MKTMIIKTR